MARLSRKSLGQRNVEDGRRGAFNNEDLVIHRETLPEAEAAMEIKDFEVQRGPTMHLRETGWLTLLNVIAV